MILAGIRIHLDPDIVRLAEMVLACGNQGILDGFQDGFSADIFLFL